MSLRPSRQQPTGLTTSAKFGSDVKMSANEMWCAVSAPGDKKVFVYNRHDIVPDEIRTKGFTGDGSTVAFVLPPEWTETSSDEELYIRVSGSDYMATRDYTYNPNTKTITFATAPVNNSDISVTYFGGWKFIESFTGNEDDWGKTIDIDSQGRYLIIGVPNRSTVGSDSTSKMGAVEIKTRHWQCFIGDGTTKAFTVDTPSVGI